MATVDQCREAVAELAGRLGSGVPPSGAEATDRTISCRVRDLAVSFTAHLRNGQLTNVQTVHAGAEPAPAQIKLTVDSDDLVALVDGSLAFPQAWAAGRIRLDASFRDLLRLRTLLG